MDGSKVLPHSRLAATASKYPPPPSCRVAAYDVLTIAMSSAPQWTAHIILIRVESYISKPEPYLSMHVEGRCDNCVVGCMIDDENPVRQGGK